MAHLRVLQEGNGLFLFCQLWVYLHARERSISSQLELTKEEIFGFFAGFYLTGSCYNAMDHHISCRKDSLFLCQNSQICTIIESYIYYIYTLQVQVE